MTNEQIKQLESDLWTAADTLRANSGLKSSEYATPILGLIFLRFADNKYSRFEAAIKTEYGKGQGGRAETPIEEIAVAKCGFYLPAEARYSYLSSLPESADIADALKTAMEDIERFVPFLKDTLPKDGYFAIAGSDSSVLKRLLQTFSNIPADAEGDLFGLIYEYFLGKFALAEGQGGGEFFTPRSVVRLMVEIIEPHHGRVFDPACGSAGMFVQSARFIEQRRRHGADAFNDLSVYGQEKTAETIKLAKMNLAVNGLRGEIKKGSSYNEAESIESFEQFDYVMANPPFNVDEVEVETVLNDPRFNTFGIPRNKTKPTAKARSAGSAARGREIVPNANYLWINLIATSLKSGGRGALVMANSASDAQHTEAEIRRRLIDANLIYGMLTLPSNMFYTVTLPATLWFFDKGKQDDHILFIDARRVFTQIDRAHREFTEDQIQNLAVISYLNRGERSRFLTRIDVCLETGKRRTEGCQWAIKDVRAAFEDALPPLSYEQTPVQQPAQKVRETLDDVRCLLEDDGCLTDFLDAKMLLEALPITSFMDDATIDACNVAQQTLATDYAAYLRDILSQMKAFDHALRDYEKVVADQAQAGGKRRPQDRKLREAKAEWDAFAADVQRAAEAFGHARWLQERFPDARYADVVGLCKLASHEEIAEQDYSLNPGRYVGVVIEEDGKTAEEFRADLLAMHAELDALNAEACKLAGVISHNVLQMVCTR